MPSSTLQDTPPVPAGTPSGTPKALPAALAAIPSKQLLQGRKRCIVCIDKKSNDRLFG